MDGQLERESLRESRPKIRPLKYFSPPKRPWDFSKVSQPRRPWDFSPPFCKEVQQVNSFSIRRSQDLLQHIPLQQCYGSFVDGIHTVRGFFPSHLPPNPPSASAAAAHRPIGLAEPNGDTASTAARRSQSSVSRSQKQSDHDFRLLQEQVDFLSKAVTEQQRKALHLNSKVEVELKEIARLKAQIMLLCEKLSSCISQWSSKEQGNKSTGVLVDTGFVGSEEYLLLKGIGELKRVVGGLGEAAVRCKAEADSLSIKKGNKFSEEEDVHDDDDEQEFEDICRSSRAKAWKTGLGTLFQAVLWCIGLIMTIVRCIDAAPHLAPT